MMSELERLVAIEEIKDMRINLFRALDHRDSPTIEALMTQNATVTSVDDSGTNLGGGGVTEIKGNKAFAAYVKEVTGNGPLVHIATMPQITLQGPDRAHGFWLVEGYSAYAAEKFGIVGLGFETIEDEYVRIDGKWLVDRLDARVKVTLK